MYTVYTDNKVFKNGDANIACNLIYTALYKNFAESIVENDFFLTGMAARIIQGHTPEPVKCISLGTNNAAIFEFATSKLGGQFGARGTVILSDQAQAVYNDSIFFELWLLETPGTIVVIDGIVMQDKANIPSFINNSYV